MDAGLQGQHTYRTGQATTSSHPDQVGERVHPGLFGRLDFYAWFRFWLWILDLSLTRLWYRQRWRWC
jgi:hypothetical protein